MVFHDDDGSLWHRQPLTINILIVWQVDEDNLIGQTPFRKQWMNGTVEVFVLRN